jgi:hypothetical protein
VTDETPEVTDVDPAVALLRGPAVQVDSKRFVRLLVVLALIGLAVATVVLFISGAHSNAQVNRLKTQGVPVQVTVDACIGTASGSGSTPASYTCNGTFTVAGHRHTEQIGGQIASVPKGSTLRGVTVPDDPALVATAQSVADEHASFSVFVLPIILAVVLLVLSVFLVARQRRNTIV